MTETICRSCGKKIKIKSELVDCMPLWVHVATGDYKCGMIVSTPYIDGVAWYNHESEAEPKE